MMVSNDYRERDHLYMLRGVGDYGRTTHYCVEMHIGKAFAIQQIVNFADILYTTAICILIQSCKDIQKQAH